MIAGWPKLPIALLSTVVALHVVEAQELEQKLERKVEAHTVSEATFLHALARIAAEFEIPMGIEWVPTPEALMEVRVSWEDVTVKDAIESLVRNQPSYDFEIRNGIVHVFPRGFGTDQRNFLNFKIDSFEVQNEYVHIASSRLRNRVNQIVCALPPPEPGAGSAGSLASGWEDRRVSFRLENTRVRDVLDKFILVGDFRVWIVTHSHTFTIEGFRQLGSRCWGTVHEQDQPGWYLLPWGYDPITGKFREDWKSMFCSRELMTCPSRP